MFGIAAIFFSAQADRLVILHTNDTHSSIDPEKDGRGGILQRKAVIDSVRRAEKHVVTVDAGDMVQGSLFFKYFRGDVEYPLFDMTGYDIRILGNHEFDNGMADLAEKYRDVRSDRLSANYDFTGTEMEGILKPYVVKKIGGKRIGFFGINVEPTSLISSKNISVEFKDPIETALSTARKLREEEKCDLVVAVTHIGYLGENDKPTDVDLIRSSSDIDIVIGGHSHTLVDPERPDIYPSLIENSEGRKVRVGQTGKYGRYVGKMSVDLNKLGKGKKIDGDDIGYEIIAVTDRFPASSLDRKMASFIAPYRAAIDSANRRVVGYASFAMSNDERVGAIANMTADIAYRYLRDKADSLRRGGELDRPLDMTIMNVGGIRHSFPEGVITEGMILSAYPFSNRFMIISMKGEDIIETMRVAAKKGGESISSNVRVVTDADRNLLRVVIDGREMDPAMIYIVGTIDYVAEGNDDLRNMANHEKIWIDDDEVGVPIMLWFERQTEFGLPVAPDREPRFVVTVSE